MASESFDNRKGILWIDGQFVDWSEAKIHVLSHALHYASAVFEGERAYNGKVFRLHDHTYRLHRSAQILGFQIPYAPDQINTVTMDLLKRNNLMDAYIRPIAWRGSEDMGVSAHSKSIHLAIACWAWPSYFSPEARQKGIKLIVSPWARPAPNTAPTAAKASGLYMICTLSKNMAEEQGCQDALMLDWRGQVAESTGANLFMVKDGQVHTPKADCFLDGITRQTVMGLARGLNITVIERAIMPDELAKADEVFLTGTAAEVTPVGQIGDWTYTPGAVTAALIEAYTQTVNS
ncbi:MAG: branched-chain amino acid aminotransferase [Alphaproteobacteria bacterium]|nr:branched-chain amino acid aminotransferase [Alphaproteobacteria bacterium]